MRRCRHTLHGLVKGLVQCPPGRSHHARHPARRPFPEQAESAPRGPADEGVPPRLGDFEQFLMERLLLDEALDSPLVAPEAQAANGAGTPPDVPPVDDDWLAQLCRAQLPARREFARRAVHQQAGESDFDDI